MFKLNGTFCLSPIFCPVNISCLLRISSGKEGYGLWNPLQDVKVREFSSLISSLRLLLFGKKCCSLLQYLLHKLLSLLFLLSSKKSKNKNEHNVKMIKKYKNKANNKMSNSKKMMKQLLLSRISFNNILAVHFCLGIKNSIWEYIVYVLIIVN